MELLIAKYKRNRSLANDALGLAELLVGMGGGKAIGVEGYEESFIHPFSSVHTPHKSGKDVYLDEKGWVSDAPVGEWEGVSVNPKTGRVTSIVLRDMELVGNIPRVLANLDCLESLNLIGNPLLIKPVGLVAVGLVDLAGEIHYTTKERTQAFLHHLKLPESKQHALAVTRDLITKHGPDGPALKAFFDANDGFPKMAKAKWFTIREPNISKWEGITIDAKTGCVTGLALYGMIGTDGVGFVADGLSQCASLVDRHTF